MIAQLQVLVYLGMSVFAFVLQVWAFVHAVTRPPEAFPRAGKRTKGFWTAVTGAAAALGFISLPAPIGLGLLPFFLLLISAVAAIVYLVDVRPAVLPYGRNRGGSGRGGSGPRGGRPGGW